MKTFVRTEILMPLGVAVVLIVTSLATGLIAQQPVAKQPTQALNGAAINPPWTSAEVLHAEDLSRTVSDKKAEQPQYSTIMRSLGTPATAFFNSSSPASVRPGPA